LEIVVKAIYPLSFYSGSSVCPATAGVTNLFAIAGHFVSKCWVIRPHNFLVILWNPLVQDCWSRLNAKVQDCWSRLNTSRAARNSFEGRMFVTPGLQCGLFSQESWT